MDDLLSLMGLGIVASAVWLTVRIVNRREKWAIRVAVTAVALLAYPLSLVPACWLVEHKMLAARTVAVAYDPLFWWEFHAPEPMQDAVLQRARQFGVQSAYLALRDTPFLRSHAVGDLMFQWEGGKRVFVTSSTLCNWIITSFEPDSWEDLSGQGKLDFSTQNRTLAVNQSRRVHAQIAAFLEKMRAAKAANSRGRDRELDFPAVLHALWGFHSEPKFRPGAVLIVANPPGDRLIVGERSFSGFGDLIDFLRQEPRESLRAGVCWNEWRWEPQPNDAQRLKELCQARDIDLFIRPNYGSIFGQPITRDWWIVRASDTIYLDPE